MLSSTGSTADAKPAWRNRQTGQWVNEFGVDPDTNVTPSPSSLPTAVDTVVQAVQSVVEAVVDVVSPDSAHEVQHTALAPTVLVTQAPTQQTIMPAQFVTATPQAQRLTTPTYTQPQRQTAQDNTGRNAALIVGGVAAGLLVLALWWKRR